MSGRAAARPAGDTVAVWFVPADLPPRVLAGLAAVLDDGELARAGALRHAGHRRRFVAAHGVARVVVAGHLGVPADRLRWRQGAYGRPEVACGGTAVSVNLSHSGELAVLAVTSGRPVGVDLQRVVAPRVTRLAARHFPAAEMAWIAAAADEGARSARFTELWVRKEACVKAAGGRLADGLRLSVHPAGPVVRDAAGVLPGAYRVTDLAAPEGFRAAVALRGPAPYQVVRRWWQHPEPTGAARPRLPGDLAGHAPAPAGFPHGDGGSFR